ncbi:Aste57867_22467 [Aphanomyces stellatus]|uniref:Aste57867_22467 protein n=1 Tax=Aphanomyces stellatus TaxID=120398 RepID=A0A485LKC0_9STRA|nr:hypothetical protein As57867_022397 [Aphanomyces stellatus]VFT99127.1 Aste57867_22467 [Aphanomyces stellatus]
MNSHLLTEPYETALAHWPATGQVILAQHTDTHVVVYQAYNPAIAAALVRAKSFHAPEVAAAGFIMTRMTWIKTNFFWMMYRSAWATSKNQDRVVALYLKRAGFDALVAEGVLSSFDDESSRASTIDEWRVQLHQSNIRLQWDPDHHPNGRKHATRRAIQMGVRRDALLRLSHDVVEDIVDVTDYVAAMRRGDAEEEHEWLARLIVPIEREYTIQSTET